MDGNLEAIYLDYNATTPVDPDVTDVITQTISKVWGNPSSSNRFGQQAKSVIENARNKLATMIGTLGQNIIFTCGGTEANNMVIHSAVQYFTEHAAGNKKYSNEKPHMITTNVEHDSVHLPLHHLKSSEKIDLTIIPVSARGHISVEDVISHIRPSTCLVTVMLANNETGIVMPISEISRAIRKVNKERKHAGNCPVLFHTDAAQAVGKISVDVNSLNVDYLTVVGHKFYGPRIGCLYVRNLEVETPIYPLLYGGGQERGFRPGTENTAMIAGLGKAADLVHKNIHSYEEKMLSTRNYLEQRLKEEFGSKITFNCRSESIERLPNTCNMSFLGDGLAGYRVLSSCERVVASVAAACHSQGKPSGVLLASGVPYDVATNAIRLSVGRETSFKDIDEAVKDMKQAVERLSCKKSS